MANAISHARTVAGNNTFAARLTRFIVLWTIAGAIFDELSELRTGRNGR